MRIADHSLELADRALSLLSRLSTRLEESAHGTSLKSLPSLMAPGQTCASYSC